MRPNSAVTLPPVRNAITNHLSEWSDADLIQAKDDVESLVEHPGWEWIVQAVSDRERTIQTALLTKVTDSAAEYATEVGHMKGLRDLTGIAEGIVAKGKSVEHIRRAMEEVA